MKGFGILFVVFAHVLRNNGIITNAFYIFHMPLFFIVSGYLIKYEKQCSFVEYLKKKMKGIMCPYFIFAILSFLYWFLLERKFRGGEHLTDTGIVKNIFLNIFLMKVDGNLLLPNVVLCFLPCLFFSNLLFFFIRKINKRYIRISITFLLFTIGYVLNSNNIILPFALETMLISIIFIDFGYEITNINFKDKIKFITTLSIIFYVIALIFNGKVGMQAHMYNNPILFALGAIGGTGIIYIISFRIVKIKQLSIIVQYIGLNSLTIMLVHEPLKRIMIVIYSKILHISESALRGNIILSFFIVVSVIATIIPFAGFVNRYMPWLIGKNKK